MKRSINAWLMATAIAVGLPSATLYAQGLGGAVGGAVDGAVGGAGGAVQGSGRAAAGVGGGAVRGSGGAAAGAGARVAPAPIQGRVSAPSVGGAVRSQPAPLNVPPRATPRVQSDARVRSGGSATITPNVPRTIDRAVPGAVVPGAVVPGAVAPGASGVVSGRGSAGAQVGSVPLRLSAATASRLGIDGNLGMAVDGRDRVRIGRLDTGSLASSAGLRMGDDILAVNRAWVRTPVDLRSQLNSAINTDGRAWVYVNRNGQRQWVNLDLNGGARSRLGVDALAARGRLGVDTNARGGVVVISNVHPQSAALAAGLLRGDEVLSVNGIAVRSHADLAAQIQAAARANGIVSLDIRRNGVAHTLRAQLGAAGNASVSGRGRLGIDTHAAGGVLTISNVFANSAALDAGLRTGDEVLAVNGMAVRTQADLVNEIRTAAQADGNVALDIRRNGVARTVRAQLDADVGGRASADVRR